MPRTLPRSVRGATKSRIVALLRSGSATAIELARALRLTGNAVRAHLAELERDGLVVVQERRPGKRKPSVVYALAPAGQALVSRAYVPLLSHLLQILEGRMGAADTKRLMRAAGADWAVGAGRPTGTLRERVEAATDVMRGLGAAADVRGSGRSLRIEGRGCPLSAVVGDHPEACSAVEALLGAVIAAPVREQCDHTAGAPPRCRFAVGRG